MVRTRLFGILLEAFAKQRMRALSLVLYLGLGWLGVLGVLEIRRRGGSWLVPSLAGGAVAYTVGAVMDFVRWPTLFPGVIGPHEVLHVAVIIGLGCHWRFVHLIADGSATKRLKPVRRRKGVPEPPPHAAALSEE